MSPEFEKSTDVPGWVWCTDDRGRSGWTPVAWLAQTAGFYWITTPDGRTGWVPCGHVRIEQ